MTGRSNAELLATSAVRLLSVFEIERKCSSYGRVEEAQMLWRTACMLEMHAREHNMHILTAEADGAAEETTASWR
jgi:hypothetical protein